MMRVMKPYSEDLRISIVKALRGGMSKSAASRLFGVSLSSVKRYARIADRGASLAPRKGGGRPPKADRTTERLLEADIRERPAATISERYRFLLSATGQEPQPFHREAALEENGLQPKKRTPPVGAMERDEWLRVAWRVTVAREFATERLVFLRTRWAPTPLFTSFTPGHPAVRGHSALCRATAGPTLPCWQA